MLKDRVFSTKNTLNIRGKIMDLSHPKVMGILNITPDSFYAGSRANTENKQLKMTGKMIEAGVDIIDIGGYSSRPGATGIDVDEEIKVTSNAISAIIKEFSDAVLSIDTFRSSVATSATEAGAVIVNDISGGDLDDKMFDTIAKLDVPFILMHMRGTPQTMQKFTKYNNLVVDIVDELQKKVKTLRTKGVKDIIIDPGFGFSKTVNQNYELLKKLDYFKVLELPVLVGISRKSMIFKTLGFQSENALNGSTVLHTIALMNGAQILRVHDVKEAVEVVNLVTKYNQSDN